MIQAHNISYQVRGKTILQDVNLILRPGKITALLGANGAGKSTLLHCLSGGLKPSSGEVILDGISLASTTKKALAKRRAVLSQANPVGFPFTALQIVLMGRSPHSTVETREDVEIAGMALHEVDAYDLKDRSFPTLSGGEQQRVHLARVLAQLWGQQDALLFLDEPTSALDLRHQHQLLAHARQRAEAGWSVLCVLHDANLAARYADTLIFMKHGRIVGEGSPATLMRPETFSDVFGISTTIMEHPETRRPMACF
jgi:iron complex transport system ATP-binding protein